MMMCHTVDGYKLNTLLQNRVQQQVDTLLNKKLSYQISIRMTEAQNQKRSRESVSSDSKRGSVLRHRRPAGKLTDSEMAFLQYIAG